ncbi:ArsR/SmtB family transcription factor [Terriglobus albidus]|uniref:ArsR/SmtB family transcription factor n=1 Tax=Terriglobus albidus TaxID=1592106 RepID=UPI0021DFFD34|nr:metalloregulator ArsR/SmtB family transcription factor [Terriglobus albidus]
MAAKGRTEQLAQIFTALSDPTRLRILNLLNGREVCVCYFVEILKEPQPKISRHLAYLRSSGMVATRKEGKWVHYSIAWPEEKDLRKAMSAALRALEDDKKMQADLRQLETACCSPQKFVTLEGAPVPARAAE